MGREIYSISGFETAIGVSILFAQPQDLSVGEQVAIEKQVAAKIKRWEVWTESAKFTVLIKGKPVEVIWVNNKAVMREKRAFDDINSEKFEVGPREGRFLLGSRTQRVKANGTTALTYSMARGLDKHPPAC